MKSTELFVEQTLTGFLVLAAAAAPFVSLETLQKLPDDAKGGIDISKAAGAIGAAYLLGVVFDRFADTLLERFNRWNRLLFAIELVREKKDLSPEDPFPEDRLQIEVIRQGGEAWEWMDYLRCRIRIARAMAAFVPALTLSLALAVGFREQPAIIDAVLGTIVAVYLATFLVSRILEKSARRLPKTFELDTDADCHHCESMMKTAREPVFWLAAFLVALGFGLIAIAPEPIRPTIAAVVGTGAVLSGISGWTWWRTTLTFMQFLYDFRKWGQEEKQEKDQELEKKKEREKDKQK